MIHYTPSLNIIYSLWKTFSITDHHGPSETISDHQRPSVTISDHQRPSEIIRDNHSKSKTITNQHSIINNHRLYYLFYSIKSILIISISFKLSSKAFSSESSTHHFDSWVASSLKEKDWRSWDHMTSSGPCCTPPEEWGLATACWSPCTSSQD